MNSSLLDYIIPVATPTAFKNPSVRMIMTNRNCQTCFEVPCSAETAEAVIDAFVVSESDESYARCISKVPAAALHKLPLAEKVIWYWWKLMSHAAGVKTDEFILDVPYNLVRGDDGSNLTIDTVEAECSVLGAFVQGILLATDIQTPIIITCAGYENTLSPGNSFGHTIFVTSERVITDLSQSMLKAELEAHHNNEKCFMLTIQEQCGSNQFHSKVLIKSDQSSEIEKEVWDVIGSWRGEGKREEGFFVVDDSDILISPMEIKEITASEFQVLSGALKAF